MSSYLDNEETLDKNSRRFDKFRSTRTSNIEDNLSHGSFIDNINQIDDLKSNKLDVGPFSNTPFKKNLANNRLHQLRERLKNDVIIKESNVQTSNKNPCDKYKIAKTARIHADNESLKCSPVQIEESRNLEAQKSSWSISRASKRNIGSVSDDLISTPDCSEPKKIALDCDRKSDKSASLNSSGSKSEQFCVRINTHQNKNTRQSRAPTFDKSPIRLKVTDDCGNTNSSNKSQPCKSLEQRLSRNKSITEDFRDPSSNVPSGIKTLFEDRNTYLNDNFSGPQHLSPLLRSPLDMGNVSRNHVQKTKSENTFMNFIELPNSTKTCPSTPVSKRLLGIREGSRKSTKASTCSIENKHYTSHVTDPYETNPQSSNFKSSKCPDPLHSNQNMSYHNSKLEMTSFWVKNLPSEDYQLPQNVPLPTDSDSPDEMEWTNAEPDLDVEINDTIENIEKSPEHTKCSQEKLKDICIVVDTNIFISALSKVKDILNIKLRGDIKPIIFIPWMVMTELDYMKDSSSNKKLQNNISDSVKFINTALNGKHPQIKGQTIYEVDKQKQLGTSPDDKIISCCLQVAERYESVILLSNDLNLKNRVMVNGISVASSHDILVKIMSKLSITTKSQKVMQKMSILCSSIICECTKEVYGNVWNKMDMLACPPWSLAECMKRFKKYWRSVFKDKLMKQFIKVMEDLSAFLADNKFVPDDSEDYIKFMKLCITLCIFLKDIEEYRGMVKSTLNEITKLG